MIGGKPVVEARVALFPAEPGGLRSPMPTGTRSLLLVFRSPEATGGEVKIGAVIDVVGRQTLVPGTDEVPVVIRFWADEAAVYATPGVAFTLWYGRPVGRGVVTRIVDEAASSLVPACPERYPEPECHDTYLRAAASGDPADDLHCVGVFKVNLIVFALLWAQSLGG
jgi:hypothetical protein